MSLYHEVYTDLSEEMMSRFTRRVILDNLKTIFTVQGLLDEDRSIAGGFKFVTAGATHVLNDALVLELFKNDRLLERLEDMGLSETRVEMIDSLIAMWIMDDAQMVFRQPPLPEGVTPYVSYEPIYYVDESDDGDGEQFNPFETVARMWRGTLGPDGGSPVMVDPGIVARDVFEEGWEPTSQETRNGGNKSLLDIASKYQAEEDLNY